jgi:hypothetical protein
VYNITEKIAFARIWSSLPSVTAWFWGHEHRLGIYEPYLNLQKGRCLGHAAIPVPDDGQGYTIKYLLVPVTQQGGGQIGVSSEEGMYRNGFAIMTLNGPSATVEYFSRGVAAPIFREEI